METLRGTFEGTSPRVRGKRLQPRRRDRMVRYIPARAGEAGRSPSGPPSPAVHPRACGGSNPSAKQGEIAPGTSPRVRGKRSPSGAVRVQIGYIPARAGEAPSGARIRRTPRVHPRACGGSGYQDGEEAGERGTSPRVRGKRRRLRRAGRPGGYIPARAGEAALAGVTAGLFAVHPRACGGSPGRGPIRGGKSGTSPRVRGKLKPQARELEMLGYIPARAGEAARGRAPSCGSRVHPRACGGSRHGKPDTVSPTGTSPRVRGKPSNVTRAPGTPRYIPARAGEASPGCSATGGRSVHPRACGGSRYAARANSRQ